MQTRNIPQDGLPCSSVATTQRKVLSVDFNTSKLPMACCFCRAVLILVVGYAFNSVTSSVLHNSDWT